MSERGRWLVGDDAAFLFERAETTQPDQRSKISSTWGVSSAEET